MTFPVGPWTSTITPSVSADNNFPRGNDIGNITGDNSTCGPVDSPGNIAYFNNLCTPLINGNPVSGGGNFSLPNLMLVGSGVSIPSGTAVNNTFASQNVFPNPTEYYEATINGITILKSGFYLVFVDGLFDVSFGNTTGTYRGQAITVDRGSGPSITDWYYASPAQSDPIRTRIRDQRIIGAAENTTVGIRVLADTNSTYDTCYLSIIRIAD